MAQNDNDWGQAFAANYMWFKMQANIAEVIAVHLAEFSPAGLELAIQESWSLVNSILELPAAERKSYLDSLRGEMGVFDNSLALALVTKITAPDLIDCIDDILPEHTEVLQRHEGWLAQEINRVRYLLNLTKV